MSELKAVIFDVDGVLHDGVTKYFDSLELFFKEKNIESNRSLAKYLNGRSTTEIREILFKEYGIDGASAEYESKVGNAAHHYITKEYKPAKELLYFLSNLKESNVPIALATSNVSARAFLIIEKLSMEKSDFKAIITAEHVKFAKPNPEIYLLAAKELNISPENCVVFEDAPNGIEAAKLAGMKVVGVKTPLHTREELSQADLTISHFGEINLNKIHALFNSKVV